jgi:hypothetical protein
VSCLPTLPKRVLSREIDAREKEAMARNRRAYGTGTLYIENDVYYGRWHTAAGGRANRRVGPVRKTGSTDGLTKKQAEARLRQLIDGTPGRVTTDATRTIEHVGRLHSAKLTGQGRKKSHVETFDSHLRIHLAPFFDRTAINRIEAVDVERLMAKLQKIGLAPKTIKNVLGSLHSIFDYALRKGWVAENPCRLVEKPDTHDSDPDISIPHRRRARRGAARDPRARPEGQAHLGAGLHRPRIDSQPLRARARTGRERLADQSHPPGADLD